MPSPLTKYQRQPKQSIDLPSKGQWYGPGSLERFEDLDVFSMTASDEIATKTPDALISGNATASIIKNCIPSIRNPWEVPMADIYTILSAIRMASYGEKINIANVCTACSETNSYDVSLQNIIGYFATVEFISEFEVEGIKFYVRPLSYKELNEINKLNFKLQRRLSQTIPLIENEDEQAEATQQVYEELSNLRTSTICTSIAKVVIEGEEESNNDNISEFITSADKVFFGKAEEIIMKNNEAFAIPATDITCASCGHESKLDIEIDYSNFFVKG